MHLWCKLNTSPSISQYLINEIIRLYVVMIFNYCCPIYRVTYNVNVHNITYICKSCCVLLISCWERTLMRIQFEVSCLLAGVLRFGARYHVVISIPCHTFVRLSGNSRVSACNTWFYSLAVGRVVEWVVNYASE